MLFFLQNRVKYTKISKRTAPFIFFLLAFILTSFSNNIQAYQVQTNQQPQTPLRIAVASNFSPVLKKLLVDFTHKTQIKTQIISSASGALYQQIKHGAPFDIFLSADDLRPQKLADEKLIIKNSLQAYAYGQLALWSANPANKLSITWLKDTPTRFAIANPNIAPYGKGAKEVLSHLGLWENYHNRLIIGMNVNQTFQQIRSQAVTAGIVAYSQLVMNNYAGFLIPKGYYRPIKQSMVILKSSKQIANAQIFSRYLVSEKAQERIQTFGYQKVLDTTNLSTPNLPNTKMINNNTINKGEIYE